MKYLYKYINHVEDNNLKIQRKLLVILMIIVTVFGLMSNTTVIATSNSENQNDFKKVFSFDLGGYTITKKETTLESKRVKIIVEKDIYLPDSFLTEVEEVMKLIEDKTKLKFYPTGKEEKVIVEISRVDKTIGREHWGGNGSYSGATVSPGGCLIQYGEYLYIVQTLLDCIYLRNSNSVFLATFMFKGFATYFSSILLDNNKEIFVQSYVNQNYNLSIMNVNPMDINKSTVQKLIKTRDNWDGILLSYHFYRYLHEEIDSKAYLKILEESSERFDEGEMVSKDDTMKLAKELFGKNIFRKFGAWYKKTTEPNEEYQYRVNDFTGMKKVEIFPFYNQGVTGFYYMLKFTYDDSVVLDYRKGFEYLQEYLKEKPQGLAGRIEVVEPTIITFYDELDKEIEKLELEDEYVFFDIPKACKIKISGDNKTVVSLEINLDKIIGKTSWQ